MQSRKIVNVVITYLCAVMSKFDLISPERLKNVDTEWEQCFICQKTEKEPLTSPALKRGISYFYFYLLAIHPTFFKYSKALV